MKTEIVPFDMKYIEEVFSIEKSSFSDPWSRDAFESSMNAPFTDFFVSLCDGRVCGYLLTSTLPPECEILNIAVSPDFRRKGVANALLSYAFERADENSCNRIMLEVRESNLSARGLYEKNDFYEVGRRKGYYKNPTEDAILMDRMLSEIN